MPHPTDVGAQVDVLVDRHHPRVEPNVGGSVSVAVTGRSVDLQVIVGGTVFLPVR
jgi:hypothetical protein